MLLAAVGPSRQAHRTHRRSRVIAPILCLVAAATVDNIPAVPGFRYAGQNLPFDSLATFGDKLHRAADG